MFERAAMYMFAGIVGCVLAAAASEAQVYPTKPIRFIVPTSPGGISDTLARTLAQKLADSLRQQIVVDNRPGAGGSIGTELAAKSPPDGYTLLMGNLATHAINPSLYKKLPYNPSQDFIPLTLVASVPEVLVIHPSLAAYSVRELIKFAKSRPRQLNYSSAGNGTTTHLSMELFKKMAGVDLVHVPYKGGVPALTDLVAGNVQAMFPNISVALPQIRLGKLRALAVTTLSRTPLAPDMPTVAESGLPGFEVSQWFGVFVPTGTVMEIVSRLHAEIVAVLKAGDVRQKFNSQGADLVYNSPSEFSSYIKADLAKWSKVVREAGARIE